MSTASRDAGLAPKLRLLCFPHAGGSAASLNAWIRRLPRDIGLERVELPGRDPAGAERPHTRIEQLMPGLWRELRPLLDRPFALYGHSLGALVAYEFARHARAAGLGEPRALFISGRRAPQRPLAQPGLHDLPEPVLIAKLTALGGMPEVLLNHPTWLRYLLPALRADLEMTDRYVHTPEVPLACPLFAFRGAADVLVSEAELDAWRTETTGRFVRGTLPGRHFLAREGTERLIEVIVAELRGTARRPVASDRPSAVMARTEH